MNEVVLLVGHGSRQQQGNREIERLADLWRASRPDLHIEVCFIEFAEVMLSQGLSRAANNARRVIVVPLILNAAGHVKMEIPEHVAEARQQHPGVEFVLMPHLGANDGILAILKRQLREAMNELDVPDPQTTGVILLGRGASDRQANGEVAKMARWLQEDTRHELVDIAFTGITWPRLERVVQRHAQLGMMQIVVLPYYLFTGTLIERIAHQVANLTRQYPQLRFAQGHYFGFEPEIIDLLNQRVADAAAGQTASALPCDGCKYRELAAELGHGHSHDHSHAPHHPQQEEVAALIPEASC